MEECFGGRRVAPLRWLPVALLATTGCFAVGAEEIAVFLPHVPQAHTLKGQLHCHSSRVDGNLTGRQVLERYQEAGYDFVCLTDHDLLTQAVAPEGLVLIDGSEVTVRESSDGGREFHVGAWGIRSDPSQWDRTVLASVLNQVGADGGLANANHPWEKNLWPRKRLEEAEGLSSISMFNGFAFAELEKTIPGSGSAMYREVRGWDQLLVGGARLWGVSEDDCHRYDRDEYFNQGWVLVQARDRSAPAILESLREGNFTACRGPKGVCPALSIEVVRREKSYSLLARSSGDVCLRAVGNGKILREEISSQLEFPLEGFEGYVRFEAHTPSRWDEANYSQPVWVLPAPKISRELVHDAQRGRVLRVLLKDSAREPFRAPVSLRTLLRCAGRAEAEILIPRGRASGEQILGDRVLDEGCTLELVGILVWNSR